MNLKFVRRVSERERAIRPFVIIVKNKLMSVCPVIDNEHYFDNVMTKFMITGQTHEKLTSICQLSFDITSIKTYNRRENGKMKSSKSMVIKIEYRHAYGFFLSSPLRAMVIMKCI